ncbi:phosphoethanolamine N-methyltransferase-like [Asterias rubens]|uniref:phosphoethanolamine N-methyltransferase-like n=1 Tax=Asterias rubens TaxID=7604 RepID=UPI00145568E8|nr:phosphoethanolamine N-methyltransferase-like [Asterias rubens]
MAEQEQQHAHADEEWDWENSKLSKVKQAFKEEFIARIALDKGHRLMDIGCAEGEFLDQLSSQVHSIVGIDIDAGEIKKANEKNTCPNIIYKVADFGTDLGDCSKEWQNNFDTIMSGFTLHFIEDQPKALKNMYDCLKPGGKLHLTYIGDKRGWTTKAEAYVRNHPKWGPLVKDAKGKNIIIESTADKVKGMIESVGFQDVQVYQDHDLAEDDYDDDDASGYIYGVLNLSFSIPDAVCKEYMADVSKFSRDNFGTNSPWEYVEIVCKK